MDRLIVQQNSVLLFIKKCRFIPFGSIDAIDILQDYSELGATLFSTFGVESDYRSLICGSYIAFYRVDDGKVYIERVLSGRRDYLRILFGDLPGNGIGAMSALR